MFDVQPRTQASGGARTCMPCMAATAWLFCAVATCGQHGMHKVKHANTGVLLQHQHLVQYILRKLLSTLPTNVIIQQA